MKNLKKISLIFLLLPLSLFALDQKLLKIWKDTMKFGISSQRSKVIHSIENGKVSEAYYLIEEALQNDPNTSVKIAAAYSLINLKISNQTVWNNALAKEKENKVIQTLVFGMTELGIRSAAPRIFEITSNKLENKKAVRLVGNLIKALGKLKYAPAENLILSVLTNVERPQQLRSSAAIALGELGADNAIGILTNIILNPGESVSLRMYSAYALGKTGKPEANKILLPIIRNEKEDLNIRLYALGGMAYIKNKEVLAELRELTKVDNARIRFEAVKALGIQKDKEAEEILTFKALYDPEMTVRKEAKKALQAMGVDVENLKKKAEETKDKQTKDSAKSTQK